MSLFVPRNVFPTLESLPRSYFLGHHRAGLDKMKTMLTHIDLVIECRDYRVPITSRNPLFEESLAGRERLIVYTKQDLGSEGKREDKNVCLSQVALLTHEYLTWVHSLIMGAEAERSNPAAMAPADLSAFLEPQGQELYT